MNCGAGPSPGTTSLRPKKSEVTTGTPFAAAAASNPCVLACCNKSSACFCAISCVFCCFRMGSISAFHLVERLHVRVLPVVHANNVEAVTALHQVADLPLGQRKRGLLKLRNRPALANPAQRSAFLCAARIFGILLRQVLEFRPSLELLQQIFRALLRLGHALLIHLAVGPRQAAS